MAQEYHVEFPTRTSVHIEEGQPLGEVRTIVEQVAGAVTQAQINAAVADYIEQNPGALSGLTDDVKQALLTIAQKVAYSDGDGQDYYDALYDALYPPLDLASISAVYTPSGTVYTSTPLDSLKNDLVVTATYTDTSTETVASADYTLSGTLTVGTSTITVSYGGKTDTFTVTVVSALLYKWDFTNSLTDEIGGRTASLLAKSGVSAPTQSSNGITFNAATQRIYFSGGDYNLTGKTIEYDVSSCQFAGNSSYHIRHVVISNTDTSGGYGMSPFVFRARYGWYSYGYSASSGTTRAWASTPWISGTTSTVVDVMSGKTVKIVIGSDGHTVSLYINNELIGTRTDNYFDARCKYLMFGGQKTYDQSKGDQCYNLVLTGFRIYEGEV